MNHWIIAPIVLPAMLAPLMVFAIRHDLNLQWLFSMAGTVALASIAVALTVAASTGTIEVYELGNWPAPFGIVLVLDRLSAMMVMLTAALAACVLVYAVVSRWDMKGRHFHPLFQFQLMGICGAFLTGDAFNLFVFFEVLLIASYGLMIHGGGAMRLRAGVQYVVINLAGSTLFLFALGTLYAVTGTLNMADMAVRVRDLAPGDEALLRVGALLLLMVFALKAALVPIHFWLPGTYANAPAPVAALFAIMTKVGAYAILRTYTLLMPAALLSLVIGIVGVLGTGTLMRLVAFSVIGSMGTLMIAIALFTPQATVAALYYMLHSTLAAAALFLIADLVVTRRGNMGDRLIPGPPISQGGPIAALFFAAAIGMAGMPPLSGFIGKLMTLDAARHSAEMEVIWTAILATSLLAIVGFARAGSVLFWKVSTETNPIEVSTPSVTLPIAVAMVPIAAMVLLAVLAGPVTSYLGATATQLYDPTPYIDAVLKR